MKKYTYGSWLEDWFAVYKKPNLKKTSLTSIEICIRLHIPDKMKNTLLADVSSIDIQKALNEIPTSRMRQYTYTVFSGSFRKAVALQLISHNPMDAVDTCKHERKLGQPLTQEEQTKFLADIEHNICKRVFTFYLYTGCRRSEALSVMWSDIDFNKNTIHLHGTKTISSNRTIPLMPELKKVLELTPHNTDRYIFPYRSDFMTKQFHKLCPTHHLHDLRHTFATRCLECGISMKVVQIWLGHSSMDTTANIYTHLVDKFSFNQASLFTLTPKLED